MHTHSQISSMREHQRDNTSNSVEAPGLEDNQPGANGAAISEQVRLQGLQRAVLGPQRMLNFTP